MSANDGVMQLFMTNAKAVLVGDPLLAVVNVIQWGEVEKHMQADYWQAMFRKGGRVPYDYRAMFRALLLARWHSLSYPKLERALRVRLDLLLFCGFAIGDKLPDASTLNRFKMRLNEGGTLAAMFAEVDQQLSAQGIQVRPARGALVEVGIVREKAGSKPRQGVTLGVT
jgi:IS5 family transposase